MDYYYYNAAGQCFPLPERPLEPPDCWGEERTRPGRGVGRPDEGIGPYRCRTRRKEGKGNDERTKVSL